MQVVFQSVRTWSSGSVLRKQMKLASEVRRTFEHLVPSRRKNLGRGEVLFQPGDAATSVYVINQGKIKISRYAVDGSPVVLYLAQADEMLGEATLFHDHYHCMAKVESASAELCLFDRKQLITALSTSPEDAMVILRLFARLIRKQRMMLEIRNIRSARQRIYTYFLLEADANQQVILQLNYKDIAYQLGMAHETFYRELRKLEDEGKLMREAGFIQMR